MSMRPRAAMPPLLAYLQGRIVTLTLLSLGVSVAMTWSHHTLRPWGIPMMWGRDVGFDFYLFRDRFLLFGKPNLWQDGGFPMTYPAFTGVVFGLLYKLAHPLRDYLALCLLALAGWCVWLVRQLRSQTVSAPAAVGFTLMFVLCCWPLWFLFDSGNIEGLAVIASGAGLLAFVARRWTWAAGLFAVAGALKIFPLVLLALLLSRRRYREFAGGMVLAIGLTAASLAMLGPTIAEAQRHIDEGFAINLAMYGLAVTPPMLDAHHSFFSLVKMAVILSHHRHLYDPVTTTSAALETVRQADAAMLATPLNVYLGAAAFAGVALYFLRIRHLPMLNQILAVTICAVTLPPLSMDYTLAHLLVPFGLLCVYAAHLWRTARIAAGLRACLLCCAFVFTTAAYWNLRYPLSSACRAMALLLLLLVALRYPFSWLELDTSTNIAPQVSAHV
jgi:hypothetical protein